MGIVRETVDILLEGTPADVDMPAMVQDLRRIGGVRGVHDLHVWSINQQVRALSAHILVDDVSISAGSTIQEPSACTSAPDGWYVPTVLMSAPEVGVRRR